MNLKKYQISLFFIFLVNSSKSLSNENSVVYPEKNWITESPEKFGISPILFKDALSELSRSFPMDEAVIAVDGRLIYQGSQAAQSHRIWSATKTFTSTVAGILIDDKKINIDQKASELLPWMNKNYPEVTLEHLLTMQSGYLAEGSRYRVDEGGDGSKTPWLSIEKKFSPAEQWSYSDDSVNILGFALSAAAQKNFAEIFIDRIARPLEMQNFNWETAWTPDDNYGFNFPVSSASGNNRGLEISALDLARLGHLYLNKGVWKGQQILSKTWIEAATKNQISPHLQSEKGDWDSGPGHYGYLWWVNGLEKPLWDKAPAKTFAAMGSNNNLCIVIPEWKMVIARINQVTEAPASKALNRFFEKLNHSMPIKTLVKTKKVFPKVYLEERQKLCRAAKVVKKWQTWQVDCQGPNLDEKSEDNPFSNYRMDVYMNCSGQNLLIPGFYAADGYSENSHSSSGRIWRAYYRPEIQGNCSFTVTFRYGNNIALTHEFDQALSKDPSQTLAFHGYKGEFLVTPQQTDSSLDFSNYGFLKYVGKNAFKFSNGKYFLKAGTSDPENFLAYKEFDNTYHVPNLKNSGDRTHLYSAHIQDWKESDPTWDDGKGKGIIGAINYLSSQGINTQYFLTYNSDGGDGNDVFPWINPDEKTRFDVSKLSQWNLVFNHMDKMGVAQHLVLEESEVDQVLDSGKLALERKLYYRELIARFAHHPALFWNLGEETNHKTDRLKEFAAYIKNLDPYKHPIVVHTGPKQKNKIYSGLLGDKNIDGASLQNNVEEFDVGYRNQQISVSSSDSVYKWIYWSNKNQHPWVVTLDEPGTAVRTGFADSLDPDHNVEREEFIWPTLIAGGAGFELITNGSDGSLSLEDFRTREKLWKQVKIAHDFFVKFKIPFWDLRITTNERNDPPIRIATTPNNEHVVYKDSKVKKITLELYEGKYRVLWFNPRSGGNFENGSIREIKTKGARKDLGNPPNDLDKDWVVLVLPLN
ncbi:MAG: serine hydrolase [Proteobacteria bacterium]|nr:serine hydrolase [Pseudomonadota bacterium]